jgi:mannose-6-phosphate isomerase-like protein (cupin superfamily)
MWTMKRFLLTQTCLCVVAVGAAAQTDGAAQRRPSEPSRPYVVMSAQTLADLERKLRPEAKAEDLIGGPGQQLRVAVQHERNKAATEAEVHDASDDVYYVLEGVATLTLGGRLEAPRETERGEWRGARIDGGRTVDIKKGDLVVVPRGTPHMRSTAGKEFSMILIKIWAEPLPQPKPSAAPLNKEQKP